MEVKRQALQEALDHVTEQAEALARGGRRDTAAGPCARDAP